MPRCKYRYYVTLQPVSLGGGGHRSHSQGARPRHRTACGYSGAFVDIAQLYSQEIGQLQQLCRAEA